MYQNPPDILKYLKYILPTHYPMESEETNLPEYHHSYNFIIQFLENIYSIFHKNKLIPKLFSWFLKAFIYRDWTMLWFVIILFF